MIDKGMINMSKKVRDIMKYRKISLVCLFIAIPLNIINIFFGNSWLAILGLLLLAVFFIMAFTLWRCPKCKRRLPLRFDKDTDLDDIYRCPFCGTKFLSGEIVD
jgi:DNA-directed RNA polymerase subunit RPC12/RpoP